MYLSNKQSYTFGAIILALLFFIACEETLDNKKIVPFGEKAAIKKTESIWFGADSLTGVHIYVSEIADSRCPEDVTCVWAGEATVDIVAVQQQDSVSLKLKIDPTNTYKTDTLDFTLNTKKYQALLYDVSPYPNKTNTGSKIATLTILKSN